MLFIGVFVLFPDQTKAGHPIFLRWFTWIVYIIRTLPPTPVPLKFLIKKKKSYFVNDRLCCMCHYPKPGLFYLFKNTLVFSLVPF